MANIIVFVKAVLTRIIFATHGFIAIWRVTTIKHDPYYWYLASPILALAFEGIFTLTIKSNKEWKWFCPSVFFYLCSVVPAIWIIEVEKFDQKLALINNLTVTVEKPWEVPSFDKFNVPKIEISPESWATVIQQFLMLILIIGRWMLPKGALTRDQLSQLLLVYIGTAADIIEFFDSFKEEKIASQKTLCLMILSIWSWSLLQFTFVLTATKARRGRVTGEIRSSSPKAKFKNGIIKVKQVCCSIDVWAILINIILQDAPFLIFRTLLIVHYDIITYMNVFFTCKNTLVIVLQFYRLVVVQIEKKKEMKKEIEKARGACGSLMKSIGGASYFGRKLPLSQLNPNRKQPATKTNNGRNRSGVSGNGGKSTAVQMKKQNSGESVLSFQNAQLECQAVSRNRLKGRRKSMSTGDLRRIASRNVRISQLERDFEDVIEIDNYEEDDIEAGGGCMIDGSLNDDSDGIEVLDDISFSSELPLAKGKRRIRLSENPGVYKISGSRSSCGSSDRIQYRQDTGYSSSSKDSAISSRRERITAHQEYSERRGKPLNYVRTNVAQNVAASRRRQMRNARNYINTQLAAADDIEREKTRAAEVDNERI